MLLVWVALAAAHIAPPAAEPTAFNPRATELFERDWVLMRWAVKRFDADGDGVISLAEAQPAAQAFRDIADGDGDGRVTPYEFDRAREFIIARY
jgi:hypothetical protein